MKKGLILLACIGAVWGLNSSFFVSVDQMAQPRFLAHRGLHQIYVGDILRDETCTASPVAPLTHPFIENTLPSMQAAFDLGAEIVELDVHLTPDGVFAVFHDWTLDCRTDGTGQTNKADFKTLQGLDVGHGYSPDGVTFPLRGTAIGMIPSLTEVFETFPDGRFLINFKSDKQSEGKALLKLLADTPTFQSQVFGVYGGSNPTRVVLEDGLGIIGFDMASVKACIIRYELLAWTGYVPRTCRDTMLAIPINYAPFLWGWPHRFQKRMAAANTDIILVGIYEGGRRINGIDTPALLDKVPVGFGGLIWTNDLPALEPAL